MTGFDSEHLSQLLPPSDDEQQVTVMLAAFEGWNDAGDAASDALRMLHRLCDAEITGEFDAEEYYDFQFTRPVIKRNSDGERYIQWPTTKIAEAQVKNRKLYFVHGIEPSYRWGSYTVELLEYAHTIGVDYLILVGALLADVPHSRPIPVNITSSNAELRNRLELSESQYEGPVGITGVISETATEVELPTVSLWAAVPHYVAQPPSPKAQLAIMNRLEELLGIPLDFESLPEDAEAWERGVNELANDDPEIAEYVHKLEEAKDIAELPEASGESIARELERYLRRKDKPEF